jgi:site-specific DNA-methyltransferase (adenine-specific)
MSDAELAFSSFDSATRVVKINRVELLKDGTIHPTQKPIKLYDWLLNQYANPNDKILDTHFGSGSIALAVDKANRLDKMNLHLTACEIDREYIDKAIKRISESIKQGTLSF